ncbi:hypothetical protein NDU88_005096 [Pleurodeles waltl]|uniref:Uncharacterized protein n=1 Tax=Pleurodeles waltl TaxID=8319 RepID=A0AAV7L8I2_PLEWA|nr:hypothetical protein NDU88_005096 [Pleurodeles waltl]
MRGAERDGREAPGAEERPHRRRVVFFPSFEDLDEDLLKEREQLLLSSPFRMMDVLIKNVVRKRNQLLEEIRTLDEIRNMNHTEVADKNYTILKDVL